MNKLLKYIIIDKMQQELFHKNISVIGNLSYIKYLEICAGGRG